MSDRALGHIARWRRNEAKDSDQTVLPWIGWKAPARTPGNEGQAFSVARAGVWNAVETKKSPIRRCFKSTSPVESEVRRFASGCQSRLQEKQRPSADIFERDAGLLNLRPMRSWT